MHGTNRCSDRSGDGSARWRHGRVAYHLRHVQGSGQRNADFRCSTNQQDEASCLSADILRCHPEPRRRRGSPPMESVAHKVDSVSTLLVRGPSHALRMTAVSRALIVSLCRYKLVLSQSRIALAQVTTRILADLR